MEAIYGGRRWGKTTAALSVAGKDPAHTLFLTHNMESVELTKKEAKVLVDRGLVIRSINAALRVERGRKAVIIDNLDIFLGRFGDVQLITFTGNAERLSVPTWLSPEELAYSMGVHPEQLEHGNG
jgi:hypothetical protein